jgi:hypothetical protein
MSLTYPEGFAPACEPNSGHLRWCGMVKAERRVDAYAEVLTRIVHIAEQSVFAIFS